MKAVNLLTCSSIAPRRSLLSKRLLIYVSTLIRTKRSSLLAKIRYFKLMTALLKKLDRLLGVHLKAKAKRLLTGQSPGNLEVWGR